MNSSSVFETPICRRLGIRFPVFQAGMGFVAHAELAAAVSNAGGLGCIGAGTMNDRELRDQIGRCRAMTDRPFAVDLLFAEIKADKTEKNVVNYTGNVQKLIDTTFEEQVPVIAAGLGNPAGIIERARRQGVTVMALCGNVKQARRLEASGVDVIIAQGHEAGGHTGRIGTMTLVPQIVDAVRVPVLAAGGIGDGRGLLAALALGAQGIWMGTRFVASVECYAHVNYKNKIVEIDEEGTTITRCHSGKPCRLVRNKFTDSWVGREAEIEPFPIQSLKVGFPLAQKARYEGAVDEGGLACGQTAGMINSIKPAGQIVRDVMEEGSRALEERFFARDVPRNTTSATALV
ncbi:MAG TPA: nitronate monooxygenase [Candidatus Binataceae bacterium]|nr:nitronate monooxygenase [Candidatus Binataceae bacterium]HTY54202.1 nitronate monooxygenase [Candidatus Binataceae bacterium]